MYSIVCLLVSLHAYNLAEFEREFRSKFPPTFNMFLASNDSLSLVVCLPGPPVSWTGKTPQCKRQAEQFKQRTKKQNKTKHADNFSPDHVMFTCCNTGQQLGDNQGDLVRETGTVEEKKHWILIGFYMEANTVSSGTAPLLVLCCWSAQNKFENWGWTLSMAKMNEAIVRVLGKHAAWCT